ELGATPAAAVAANSDRALAAGDERNRRRPRCAVGAHFPRERAIDLRDLARFAGDRIAEHGRVDAVSLEKPRGRHERIVRAGDDTVFHAPEDAVTGFGRLRQFAARTALEMLNDRDWRTHAEALED